MSMARPHPAPSSLTALEAMLASARANGDGAFTAAAAGKAKICLLDFLSCAFEAADLPWTRQAVAASYPVLDGSVIAGQRRRTTPEDAAFANGVAGHGLVREDMHAGSIAHLGVVVWPTLLALAEGHEISGERMLRAAIMGYETGGRIGRKLMTPEVARLFRPTGLVGPMAAAMAGAYALGLGENETLSALSLAANCAFGLNQWPHHGADEMYFHPGFAARSAMRAIALARAGAWASPAILEGKAGLFAAYGRARLEGPIELFPGGDIEILNVFNKQVPACNFAQSPCQAALAALEKSGRAASDIAAIHVQTYDAALNYPGCASKGPFERPLAAKMSIAFGVAATLARGEIAEENYSRLEDAEIAHLVSLVEFGISDALNAAFPGRQGAEVTLRFKNGESASHALDDIVFADAAHIEDRCRKAGAARLGATAIEEIVSNIKKLQSLPAAGPLVRLLGQPADAAEQ